MLRYLKSFLFCFLIIFLIVGNIITSAQTSNIRISSGGFIIQVPVEKSKKNITKLNGINQIDYFEFTDYSKSGKLKLPVHNVVLAIPEGSDPTIGFKVLKSENFSESFPSVNPTIEADGDSGYLVKDETKIHPFTQESPNNVRLISKFYWRDFYCIQLQIPLAQYNHSNNSITEVSEYELSLKFREPFHFESNSPIEVRSSFDKEVKEILLNSQMAEQFRITRSLPFADTTGNWINYNSQYLKIGTVTDKIYRITYSDIMNFYPQSVINPKTFRLFKDGKEVEIFVYGEEDGVFDSSDYVEFFGGKNYTENRGRKINNSNEEYNEYLNRYSDTVFYFLTWGGQNGIRCNVKSVFANGLIDTLNYYTHFTHTERNTMYQSLSVDVVENQLTEWTSTNTWVWEWFGVQKSTRQFSVSNLVPNKNAAIYQKMISAGSSVSVNSHNISMRLDTALIDSQVVNRNAVLLLGKTFNSSLLKTGTNSFVVQNFANSTTANSFALDWYEIEYSRYLIAKNDSLYFEIRDSLTAGHKVVIIDSVTTSDVVLYKVKPSLKKIQNFFIDGVQLIFTDTIMRGDIYCLLPKNNIPRPEILRAKSFVNLRSPSRSAEYIAITHSSLQQSAEQYTNFIEQQYQISTELINVSDIFDEFSYGQPDPTAIRGFLQSAYSLWQAPKPSFLNLIGIATYDYKNNYLSSRGYQVNYNLVPSFGEPVSDPWFVIWDSPNTLLQSMYVGRIPAKNNEDVLHYLTKHQNYISQRYDAWNKRALLFSSGDGNDSLELVNLRSINLSIIRDLVEPAPLSLSYSHFYKTVNPNSDFGPYTPTYIRQSIEAGGSFISYIGHSGTRTWDNSIADPNQLLNKVNKSPIVTDFGCSTNKFAEPDVDAFGSLFVNDGQTIGYIGNTSLGFTTTSTSVPYYFYNALLKENDKRIGAVHYRAKLRMFGSHGTNGTYKIFAYSNVLLGDPIVGFALPDKPNLVISQSGISVIESEINDKKDSVTLSIKYSNLGMVTSDTLTISVSDFFQGSQIFYKEIKTTIPEYEGIAEIKIPVFGKPGIHRITISLDPSSTISEMYEDDNLETFDILVASLSLRPITIHPFQAISTPSVKFLNTAFNSNSTTQVLIQYDTIPTFTTASSIIDTIGTFYTKITLPNLKNEKRYYVRFRENTTDTLWGSVYTFYKSTSDVSFFIGDSSSIAQQTLSNLLFDNGLKLTTDTAYISIKSGGGNFSKYGSITKNNINLLSNTFGWGMGIAILDPITLNIDTARTFNYGPFAYEADSLASLINRTPNGKLVLMNIIDDGSANLKASLKTAIKSCGSLLVDSISFREPWVMIGVKGSAPGTAREIIMPNNYLNILTLDTFFVKNIDIGTITSQPITNVRHWRNVVLNAQTPSNSSTRARLIGTKSDGSKDTLSYLTFNNGIADISTVSVMQYPVLQLQAELQPSSSGETPTLNSMGINFDSFPELGLNYQSVNLSDDSIYIFETSQLDFSIYNAGESDADSFKIKVETVWPDNSISEFFDTTVARLQKENSINFSLRYTPEIGPKDRKFRIIVDEENKISEFYEDNNSFLVPFTVLPDTAKSNVVVTMDGREIIDGEFVQDNPEIKVEVFDPTLQPINDTSYVLIKHNDTRIYYNNPAITYSFNLSNPKMVVTYKPRMFEGENEITVFAKNSDGTLIDSLGYTKTLIYSSEFRILSIFNYPNPFGNETHFTFRLTQIPEEMQIKIYSIAGRLVKTINVPISELKTDFNKISWDGRDEDGELLSNGVYLYKCIVVSNGNSQNSIHKLAITR